MVTLNMGAPTGKEKKVAAVILARKMDIWYLQELRWADGEPDVKARAAIEQVTELGLVSVSTGTIKW